MSAAPFLDPGMFDDAVAAVALLMGPEHRLLYVNPAFTRLFGPRTLGLPAREAFPEPDASRFLGVLEDVRRSGRPRQVTGRRRTDPGALSQARHFVYSCTPVATRRGGGILAIAMDTTAETYTLQRYEALATAVSQMVWVMWPNGTMDELVPGWEAITGLPWRSRADDGWFAVVHPRDRDALHAAWLEAAAEPQSVFEHTFRVRTAGGAYRHMFSRAVPVVRDGSVAEWIAATADVEDAWRTQLRERLLAQIAERPRTSLAQAFGTVVDTIVPEVADACLILTLDHDEWPVPSHVALRAGRIASASRPGLPAPPALLGQSVPVTAPLRELLEQGAPRTFVVPPGGCVPPGLVPRVTERWLTAAGATSVTLVPLRSEDTLLGYAVAATCDDSPVPGPAETELLRDVLHHAQQPIHRVLEHGRARRTALRLQRAQLTRPPEVPGAAVAARYQPASSTREIGGDWYDAFLLPDRSLVLDIGDVAGHDLTAAAAMGQMRSMLRALAYSCGLNASPCDVLEELDAVAEGLEAAPFTTVVHAHLRPRQGGGWNVAWSNAGHPPPLLIPARGTPRYLTGPVTDPPLCVDPGLVRTTHHHVLSPGDTLLLYTDGLIERPATTLTRGQNRLVKAALRHRRLPLDDLLHRLLTLSDHRDDTAMIAFRAGSGSG
ncbi:SpoIIE family protein phosphatase [Streptomyces sp. NPDC057682]|uniref:SpoIIE family protein phosphatase n=1 Tax=Streptomyces sp. NPDC057682 TaxID=3346210 RepID=UPI0036AE4A8A